MLWSELESTKIFRSKKIKYFKVERSILFLVLSLKPLKNDKQISTEDIVQIYTLIG